MEKINSIKFIDSLAEITRYRDREVIERSLLKTLLEFESESSFRLYQVLHHAPALKLGMLAFASNDNIITAEEVNQYELPAYFTALVNKVVNTGKIICADSHKNNHDQHILYPAFNANDEIFAILIQTSKNSDYEKQRFVHGFLRIYSNYLEMIEVTKRDKLTGLLNRETLDPEITRILIRNNIPTKLRSVENMANNGTASRRYNAPLKNWLCVLDIDHFKLINDQYGHIYGDEILILVARLLENSVREFDKIFRFGGEEFVILMKSYDAAEALLAFERIRCVIATHHYAKISSLTVSIGGTEITNQNDPRNIIEAADIALYYAKQNGRNQVHLYESLITENKVAVPNQNITDSEIKFF